MGATLDALHRLQEVELRIADIRRAIDRKRRLAEKQEQRVAELDRRLTAGKAALRSDQMEADRLDLDVKSREVDIARLRQALQSVRTNKEYSALLTQLNTLKADGSKVEDRVLALLTEIDAKRGKAAGLEAQREAEATKLESLHVAVREQEESSRDKLGAMQAERDEAALDVPPAALAAFNRIAERNDGKALAMVVRTNPKRAEYACEGCNMAITIEQVNAILSRDEAIICNNCGQILFINSPAASGAR